MNPFSVLSKVAKQVYDPQLSKTYFPGEDLKSKPAIFLDHLYWLIRHKEINKYYFIYGLDRKNVSIKKDVLPYKEFRRIRDGKNLHPKGANFNYASLLRDKFIFGQFLDSLKFPTPKNIALFENGKITWLDTMANGNIDELISKNITVDGFCKKLTGLMGEGAFPLKVSDGKIEVADKIIDLHELKAKMSGAYLWQERIIQNEKMASLHADSVNTVRLISFNNNGKIEIFSGTLRIGTLHHKVDNWNAGGIAVGIDVNTGRVRQKGLFKPGYGTGIEVHPDSGIRLLDFQIPFFEEAVELTKQLHSYFYGIHSIGWDIGFTATGPVFVEGNDDWDGCMPMSLEENFKNRFLKMFNA